MKKVLLYYQLIQLVLVESSFPTLPLTCHAQEPYIHLAAKLPADCISRTQSATNLYIQYQNQSWISGECFYAVVENSSRIELDCRMWEIDADLSLNPIRTSTGYKLQIAYTDNDTTTVIANTSPSTWDPYDYMYYCFEDHNVRGLKLMGKLDDQINISWSANENNRLYDLFLDSQVITVTADGMKLTYTPADIDCDSCTFSINGLAPCTKYRICVETRFMDDYDTLWSSCISATTTGPCKSGRSFLPMKIGLLVLALVLALCMLAVWALWNKILRIVGAQRERVCPREISEDDIQLVVLPTYDRAPRLSSSY